MVYHVDFVRVLFSLAVKIEISFELQLKTYIKLLINFIGKKNCYVKNLFTLKVKHTYRRVI